MKSKCCTKTNSAYAFKIYLSLVFSILFSLQVLYIAWNQVKDKQEFQKLVSFTIFTYRKVPKFLDARKLCCNLTKIQTNRPNLRLFHQKDADGIANSENPDKTVPLGAVLSGSALFAQTYLSENLGSLWSFSR